jgi:hypothetical protein
MRWLRRSLFAALLLVALVAIGVSLIALLLPRDATSHVQRLGGEYGGFEQLAAGLPGDGSSVRHVALRNTRGEAVTSAWIRRPLELEPDYRIVLTYAGAKTGETILELIPHADNLVVIAVQYPWSPPRGVRAHLRALYDMRQAAYRTVAGGLLAVDYLQMEETLEPDRMLLLGASLGSVFATLHGAVDPRVPRVVLVHGGTDLSAMLTGAIENRTPALLRRPLVALLRIPVATFDPGSYVARISPRELVIVGATSDRHFSPAAVTAFYQSAGEPKQLRWTDTGHVGAGKPEIVQVVLSEIEAFVESRPALP